MNNILRQQWTFIKEESERLGLPVHNKRAILREYLQTKILNYMFESPESRFLSFMGGTCLRIIYGLDRFSEDLDFDLFTSDTDPIHSIITHTSSALQKEGLLNELTFSKTGNTAVIKFPDILSALDLSPHEQEKVGIKVDWDTKEKIFEPYVHVLSRFGVVQRIIVNPLSVIFSEKILAIYHRSRTIPRDFYDIVFLLSKNISPDTDLLNHYNISLKQSVTTLQEKFKALDKDNIESELRPFVFNKDNLKKLDMFNTLITRDTERGTRDTGCGTRDA